MKAIILFILVLVLNDTSQSQGLQWAVRAGSATGDGGNSITVDKYGSVYTTGYFTGTVDFDPGPGVFNLISAGGPGDCFIQKLDNAGNFLWAVQFGGIADDHSICIQTDFTGNLYVTGYFTGTVDFDPGEDIVNITSFNGSADIFILKIDDAGNFIWVRKAGGLQFDTGMSLVLDANSNIYCTGHFSGLADFDPGIAAYYLTSSGSSDVFVLKLNATGDFVWAKKMGGTLIDMSRSIVLDSNSNVYTTGFFTDVADFDPNAGIYNLVSAGNFDIFISKLDSNGNFVWARSMGNIYPDEGYAIATDNTGNVYTTGHFKGVVDFDPGPGAYNISAGDETMFITKLSSAGNFVWAKSMNSSFKSSGQAIILDNAGSIFTTGNFIGITDFDPGPGVYNLVSNGNADIFLSKLDSGGNFTWAVNMGGLTSEGGKSLSLAGDTVYSTGIFYNTCDFDPSPVTFNLTSAGDYDMFVYKYIHCGVNYNVNYDACDSIFLFGTIYTASKDTVIHYSDVNGCDSNQNIHIQIYPTLTFLTQTVCDSFTLNAQTYTSSGIYIQTLLNAIGCDSIITLNLTVNYSASDTILQQAYGSYTLNGQTYFASGIYTQILTGMAGCDSVIILNLNIESNNPCTPDIIINSSPYVNYLTESQTWIMTSGTVLIPLGTYAKLDANANSYITLNPGFKADFGSVFVAQAFNGCTAGAPQLPNAKIFNGESGMANEIILYPNPTSGMIHIKHDEKLTGIQIFDMVGKLIINQKCAGETETIIDLSNLPNGVYHVKVAGYNSIKVVKNH